jgi:glycosyltransferase involved in cell wall biosynthesis
MKVTVLMPVYNAEKYLSEAIESILGQTYKDFEFLIMNDGSSDRSVELIQSYQDARIKLVNNAKNIGLSPTLNIGIGLAVGKYIARMDSDDISLPTRLEKQMGFMEAHPEYAMVSTWARTISEDGKFKRENRRFHKYSYYNLIFKNDIWHPSVLCKKEILIALGKYPHSYAEDFYLWSKMAKSYKIHKLDEALLLYRHSATSLSNVIFGDKCFADAKEVARENINFYLGANATIPEDSLECYAGNYTPLLQANSADKIISCLAFLKKIDQAIMNKENVNLDVNDVKAAAKIKRKKIIGEFFRRNLATKEKLKLIFLTGSFSLLGRYIMRKAMTR